MEEQMKQDRKEGSSVGKITSVYVPEKFQDKLPKKQQHKKEQKEDNKFEEMLDEEVKGRNLDITGFLH